MKPLIQKFVPRSLAATAAAGLLALAAVIAVPSAAAATVASAGNGAWNSTTANAPWPGGTVPATGDTVTITSGNTVTVTAAATCANLTVNGTLNYSGNTLKITGTTDIYGNYDMAGVSGGGAQVWGGLITIHEGGSAYNSTGTGGTSYLNGGITVMPASGSLAAGSWNSGAGANISINANSTLTGTMTIPKFLVYSTSGTHTITNSGNVTAGPASCVGGTGNWLQGSGSTLNCLATPGTTGTFNATASGNTVNYAANGLTAKATAYSNLTLSAPSTTVTVPTGTSVAGTLSIQPSGTGTAALATGLNLTPAILLLGGVAQAAGTYGSTASSATNKLSTYFGTTALGIVTVTATSLSASAGSPKTVTPSLPSATIGGSPTASGGTGPYTYSWSPTTGLSDPTAANPTASPTATTTYTVTVTDSASNTANASVLVTYSVPALIASAGSPQTATPSAPTVTIGGTPTASGGTGGYTYSWSPTTGLSNATAANPTASPTATTTYTVTVTDSASSTATASVVITYTVPPLVANAGVAQNVYAASPSVSIGGSPTASGGTGGYTYSWSPSTGLNDATLANPTASPTATTTYTVTVTDSASSTASASVVVSYVTPDLNLISVDVVTSTSAPVSGNVAGGLAGTQIGAWNSLVGSAYSTPLSNLKNGAGATTGVGLTVSRTGYGGFQAGSAPAVTGVVLAANNPERLWVSGAGVETFQFTGLTVGASYDLAIFNTGSSKTVITINGGTPHTGIPTILTTTEVADGSGHITAVVSFNGAQDSDYAEISGLQLDKLAVPLAASAGSDKAVSAGLPSVLIGGSPTASGGTAPYTYSWSPSTSLDDATLANPTASPVGTTLYTVTVTDSATPTPATATSSMTVTYTAAALAADAGPDASLTPAAPSVQLGGTPSASGGFPSYTYSWTPTTGLSDPTIANPIASPSAPTTYTLTVTDSHSATATDTVFVDYPLVVNAGADQSVTPGNPSVQIGGSPASYGGTPPLTYSWSPSTGLNDPTLANPTASPTATTTYTLTVTDALSVVASDSVTLTYSVPNAALISLDVVTNGSVPVSGDVAGSPITGQSGPWNALALNGGKVTLSSLNGGPIGFVFDSASVGYHVQVAASPYNPGRVLSGDNPERSWITGGETPVTFKFTGLTVGATCNLVVFTTGDSQMTLTINGTAYPNPGTIFTTSATADGNGEIVGVVSCGGATYSDYAEISGLQLQVTGSAPSGYATWATLHAGGQTPGEDFNHDGVQNGIAYFMGMDGLATNPGVVNGKVTWPHVNAVSAFEVEVSTDLVNWTTADPASVDSTTDPTQVVFTLPTGATRTFCRLSVTP